MNARLIELFLDNRSVRKIGAAEFCAAEVRASKLCVPEVGPGEVCAEELRVDEDRVEEVRAAEVRAKEIRGREVRTGEVRVGEIYVEEVRAGEIRAEEVRVAEIRAGEVRRLEISTGKLCMRKFNAREISRSETKVRKRYAATREKLKSVGSPAVAWLALRGVDELPRLKGSHTREEPLDPLVVKQSRAIDELVEHARRQVCGKLNRVDAAATRPPTAVVVRSARVLQIGPRSGGMNGSLFGSHQRSPSMTKQVASIGAYGFPSAVITRSPRPSVGPRSTKSL